MAQIQLHTVLRNKNIDAAPWPRCHAAPEPPLDHQAALGRDADSPRLINDQVSDVEVWLLCETFALVFSVLQLCKMQKAPCCSNKKGLVRGEIKLLLSLRKEGEVGGHQVRCSFTRATSYSAFLAFLLRAPSLSSSLLLSGEDGAAPAGG